MAEYIDKNKAIELIKELENIKDVSEAEEWVDIFITTINELPMVVIEAEPKHGRWKVLASGNDAICTNCEHYWIPNGDQYDYLYCPYCGARMDEVEE